jgi:hypothetical protein
MVDTLVVRLVVLMLTLALALAPLRFPCAFGPEVEAARRLAAVAAIAAVSVTSLMDVTLDASVDELRDMAGTYSTGTERARPEIKNQKFQITTRLDREDKRSLYGSKPCPCM